MKNFVLVVNFVFTLSLAYGSEEATLVQQTARPTLSQIRELIKDGKFGELKVESHLPYERGVRGGEHLYYNYPEWFRVLIQGAPQMIANFERSFPGATWAFIGRDMSIIADAFESFYESLGQRERVVRLGMSRGTLIGMTDELAIGFLNTHGLDPAHLKHPLVFVDTVSWGGGRQGRALIQAIYNTYPNQNKFLSQFVSFIGLVVSTTGLEKRDLSTAHEVLRGLPSVLEGRSSEKDIFTALPIFTYSDAASNGYLGINEAGYSHWTGAWHGPYGPLYVKELGTQVQAQIMDLESKAIQDQIEEVRSAIIKYQVHVVRAVSGPPFLETVREEAQKLGYEFPETRPTYYPEPLSILAKNIQSERDLPGVISRLKEYTGYNLNRVSSTVFDSLRLVDELGILLEPPSKKVFKTALELFSRFTFGPDLTQVSVPSGIALPLSTHPAVLSRLIESIQEEEDLSRLVNILELSMTPIQKNILGIHLNRFIEFSSDFELFKKLSALLGEEDRNEFEELFCKSRKVRNNLRLRFLKGKDLSSARRKERIEQGKKTFFALHPTVDQINELILLSGKSSAQHQKIVIQALKKIKTLQEYQSLIQPNIFFRQKSDYKAAVLEFKMRHIF